MRMQAGGLGQLHPSCSTLIGLSLLAGALVAGSVAVAQSRPQEPYVPQYTLTAGQATPVGGLDWVSTLGFGVCDANANLYLRIVPAAINPRMFTTPLTEFSVNGEKKTVFSPAGAPGWAQGEFVDFTVGNDGTVYLLADRLGPHRKVETAILGFEQDGNIVVDAPLDLPVSTYDHIAVFSTGDFLVIGPKNAQSPLPRIPGTPVTAKQLAPQEAEVQPLGFVVHRDGRLAAEVVLPADPLSVDNGKASGAPLAIKYFDEQGNGAVVAGNDGNVYAMFPTATPLVYAISPAGQIVHSFAVKLPSPAYSAIGAIWAGGLDSLLIESAESKDLGLTSAQTLLSVVDPSTGQRTADYKIGPDLGALPACFAHQHIYFLGSDKGKLVIRAANER